MDSTASAALGFNLANTDDGEGSLRKIKDDGELAPIFAVTKPENTCCGGPNNDLPKIKTIAISPTKEIFLHFERPFIYRSQLEPRYLPRPECNKPMNPSPPPPPAEGGPEEGTQGTPPPDTATAVNCSGPGEENPAYLDPWDMTNGFQCQIFKVVGGAVDELTSAGGVAEGESNLECLDNQHFIDSWQAQRNSVFQFDNDGNVYYPGSAPNGGHMVVYRRSNDGSIREMINSNICVQDFLVSLNGGMFYTGSSSCNGGGGNGGGFFRYVNVTSSGIELREIARDWWNFVFEAVAGASGDQAVFFGPDPRSATTASWNSACLFRYDPSLGTSAQATISNVITCGADINSWIDMRRPEDQRPVDEGGFGRGFDEVDHIPAPEWKVEFQRRCSTEGQVFAGGGSQINAIKQDSNGKIYVIGQVRKKKLGAVACNVHIKGPHCLDKDDIPHLPSEVSKTECGTVGGTWVHAGRCQVDFNNGGWTVDFPTKTTAETCLGTALDDAALVTLANERNLPGGANPVKVRWTTERTSDYNNVASPICTLDDDAGLTIASVRYNIWDWNTNTEAFETVATGAVTEDDITYGPTRYATDWWRCLPVADDGSTSNTFGPDGWLTEYKGLAEVDTTTKSLVLRSAVDEQAINLWLVNDVPYYSSFNTAEGRYFLKRYSAGESASEVVAADFETYNLSVGSEPSKMFYDGLDFQHNEYSFGTMLTTAPFTREPKTGLSGQVKMIVVLPK